MGARRSSRTARLLVLLGILTVLGVTFGGGVYAGRIWQARSLVVAARVPDPELSRRGLTRGLKPDPPAPQLTFYQELTAPLTAPPPPPKPAKTAPPRLVSVPPPLAAVAAAPAPQPAPSTPAPPAPRPGEQADLLAAMAKTSVSGARYTIQIASYRVRPLAEALRSSLASAGHEARVVEADANGVVYRVQVGEFATRDAARAAAARLGGTPFITTR
jgi:septal ring-binding cell division protein DamX